MSDTGNFDSISSEVRELKEQLAEQTRHQREELSLRRTLVADGVDEAQRKGKSDRRRTLLTLVAVLPLVASAFGWSWSTIRDQQAREVAEAKREQRADTELQRLSVSSKATAEKLVLHETAFDKFREQQRLDDNLRRWERRRHTDMLESTLRGLGRRVEGKKAGHIQAETDAGLLR